VGHTLYDSAALIERNGGKPPLTYKAFEKLMKVLPCTCTVPLSCPLEIWRRLGGCVFDTSQLLCTLRMWARRQRR
jgi:hypothetical protein